MTKILVVIICAFNLIYFLNEYEEQLNKVET